MTKGNFPYIERTHNLIKKRLIMWQEKGKEYGPEVHKI